jgi:hypothetical protein
MEIQVIEELMAGYTKPVFSFTCPMCEKVPVQDLDRGYVLNETWRHLITFHRVLRKKIDVVVIAQQTLDGLEKVV